MANNRGCPSSTPRTALRAWRRQKRATLAEWNFLRDDSVANRLVRGAFDSSREESFVKKGKKQELTSRSTSRILNRRRASCFFDLSSSLGTPSSSVAFVSATARSVLTRRRRRTFDAQSNRGFPPQLVIETHVYDETVLREKEEFENF